MLTVKVLGSGCENCKKVEGIARKVVTTMGMEAEVIKVLTGQRLKNIPY